MDSLAPLMHKIAHFPIGAWGMGASLSYLYGPDPVDLKAAEPTGDKQADSFS